MQTRLIKKHANRRFYDTESKQYVSIDDIYNIISGGVDIRIEDSKSGDDITVSVLLHIMADCEQSGRPMLSPTMLMSLIRHYGHPMQEFVGPFLEKNLGFYLRHEARIRKRFSDLVLDGESLDAGREGLSAMRDLLTQMLGSKKAD